MIDPTDYACAAYIAQAQRTAPITTHTPITSFRAFLISTSGPGVGGTYKLVLGTDTRHKDALWILTDHLGEFFEIAISQVRVTAPPTTTPPSQPELNGRGRERISGAPIT